LFINLLLLLFFIFYNILKMLIIST